MTTAQRKIVVAGGTGFLGRPLVAALSKRGYDVVVLSRAGGSRQDSASQGTAPSLRAVEWQPDGSTGAWAREIDGAFALINLAGAGLADKRWSSARKEELRSSRVLSTRSLVAAVRSASSRPAVFIQGSAVGFYGFKGDGVFDESFPPGAGFLGEMAVAWEAEARPVESLGVRLVLIRTGVVLARDGGALAKLTLPFKLFVGGPIGDGHQYLSWIHRDDWIAAVLWALEHDAVTGAINASAPGPVTNAEFSRALGRALGRPSWLPVPGLALRVLVGEMADEALIGGQRVVPARLESMGFTFAYPDINSAMTAALRRS